MLQEIDLTQARSLVDGIEIPAQPAVLKKIMEIDSSNSGDINGIAKAISNDVSLSASILKAVNSPLYGLKNQISSIHQATSLLGMNNVMNLVIGLSLQLEIKGKFNISLDRFWETANDVALLSAGIAKRLSIAQPDEAYLLGLFHDCGIPLLMLKHENYMQILRQADSTPDKTFTEVEDQAIHTNHAVVGFYVAKSWRLPERVRLAILNHHERDMLSSDDRRLNNLIANLKMAEAIRYAGRYMKNSVEWETISETILNYINLTEPEFTELKDDMVELLNE